ncbi:MAG: ABC transporter permease [Ferruginibacter sp.]|nr:hypothetical protein [Ferruginibacter sp.]
MINLLKIEWLKIKNYGAFKIMAIFFAVGVVLANYIVFSVNKNVIGESEAGMLLSSYSPYNFDNTWQTTSYASGYLLLLPAMLIIILVTNEYTFRTNRQNVIDGWSREQFITVKLAIALIVAIVSTIIVILTAMGFGFTSNTNFSTSGFSHVGFFFLKALTYNLFAVLISVLIKKTGFAIGVYFIYIGIENVLAQALDTFGKKITKTIDLGTIGDYLPMNAADGLLTFPDNPIKGLIKNVLPTSYFWAVLGFTIFYILLFFWWSRKKYMTSDL